jgi:Flp pilus assembly protein TadD
MEFGVKMARKGLWSEALFRFEQAERLDPSNPRILNNLAVAFEATGQFEKALDQYQKALRASPNDKTLRRNYARFVEFYQNYKPDQEGGDGERSAAEG